MIVGRDEGYECKSNYDSPDTMYSEIPVLLTNRPDVIVEVFSVPTPTLLDSGASISAISEEIFLSFKVVTLPRRNWTFYP